MEIWTCSDDKEVTAVFYGAKKEEYYLNLARDLIQPMAARSALQCGGITINWETGEEMKRTINTDES
jgi:hypothetical protein